MKDTEAVKDESDCELEVPDDVRERLFAAYCFFEDTHRIQEFIKKTWQEYKEGLCDLMTAALITNLGIDIVKTEEAKIYELNFPGDKPCYFKLVDLLWLCFFAPSNFGDLTDDERYEFRARIQTGFVATQCDSLFYRWTARYQLKNHEHWREVVSHNISLQLSC